MDHVMKSDIEARKAFGIESRKVFGVDGYIHSEEATESYIHADAKMGKNTPHKHGTEALYVVDAKDAVICCGIDKADMKSYALENDDTIYITKGDWHCFDFTSEDGYLDAIAFFPNGNPEVER